MNSAKDVGILSKLKKIYLVVSLDRLCVTYLNNNHDDDDDDDVM